MFHMCVLYYHSVVRTLEAGALFSVICLHFLNWRINKHVQLHITELEKPDANRIQTSGES